MCSVLLRAVFWNPAARENGFSDCWKAAAWRKIRFHDLRHTFATLALQNGIDVKTVSSMLGHSSAGFTLATYTHATNKVQEQAAAKMGNLLKQAL